MIPSQIHNRIKVLFLAKGGKLSPPVTRFIGNYLELFPLKRQIQDGCAGQGSPKKGFFHKN